MENLTENKVCEKCGKESCVCEAMTETTTAPVISETTTEVTLPTEPIEEKVTFKHPALDNKSSNSRYVMSFEAFKNSKVKVEKGLDKTFAAAQTSNVSTDKAGESKKPLDNKAK